MAMQDLKNLFEEKVRKPLRKRHRLPKPFRSNKLLKTGEDEDDWCDALNHLSLDSDSDEEYFDALEKEVTSKSLPTETEIKIAQARKPSTNKYRYLAQSCTPSTSGLGSRTEYEGKIDQRQRQIFPRHLHSGDLQLCTKDSSTSPPMETEPYHLAAGGSNTATSFSSEAGVQVGFKRLTSIHDLPQEHPVKGFTVTDGIPESKLEKLAKALLSEEYRNVRLLGQKLGFSLTELYGYCPYVKPNDSSGILRMLRAWKDKTPDAKQMPDLLEALKKANLKHLADDLHSQKGKLEKRKVTITLMTSWHLSSIEGLKKKLMTLQRVRPDIIEAVKVLELPFSGIQRYTFTEDVDIMVLCHSIVNRRFGITNVTDSLYDEFLNYCNKKLGKERIAVIAHDFEEVAVEVRAVRMETFKHTQWSTFEKAGLVMICGMMDKTPEIQEKDWNTLVKFLEDSSKSTPTKDDTDNDEGNDDQQTSLKHDSESNQDDMSFDGFSAPPEILARGPRARQAYAEAAKYGTMKVFRTRLMLVGQERVGKTSLKKTLTGQGFDRNEAPTDGVETTNACEICIEAAKAGEKMWSIHKEGHWNEDTKEGEYNKALAGEIAKRLSMTPPPGQERLESNRDTILSGDLNPVEAEDKNEIAQKLTVTPLTQQQDQDSLEPHSDIILGRGLNPVKADEPVYNNVEKILKEQVRSKEIGTGNTDSTGGEGVSLSIWDFAGHDIYYTTHQVFLTWRAIYVTVFDLSRSLDSVVPPESRDENYEMVKGNAKSELTCLEFINFWLCSIYAHAVAPSSIIKKNTSKNAQISPPIFIVGTHRESVKGDAKEKKEKIDSAFEKIRESIKKKPFECHVVPKYYAIENSLEDKDEELVALRRHIEKVAMEEPYMGEEIPLRWLKFEEALAADKTNYMSLDETKQLTQPFGMESERELLTMLTFYHDLGYVVYFGGIEDQQSLLQDIVILNPQWLIDVFKQVITILDPVKRDGIVSDAWTTLEKDGILEDKLIHHMWQCFLEQKEALVNLMAKFDLICEAPLERLQQEQQEGVDIEVSNETKKVEKKRYYVPSRMTSRCPPEEIAQIKYSTDFYVDFRRFLPDGLFHRLMTRAVIWIGERNGEPVNLFYRHISLMVDDVHHALLEMLPPREATIKVTVFRGAIADSDHDGDSHEPPAPSAVKEVMDFITETLDSLIQHWARRIEYDVRFLCPSPKCSNKQLLKDCNKGMSLKCGLHTIRTAVIKFKYGVDPHAEGAPEIRANEQIVSKECSAATEDGTKQDETTKQNANECTSQLVMKDILTDMFLLRLSSGIDLTNVPAVSLSLYLGFCRAEGTAAMIEANNISNPQSALFALLSKFVMAKGRKSESALNLRKRFLENGMKDSADVIKAELEKLNIPDPSDEEMLVDTHVSYQTRE